MESTELARWQRFAAKGGIGRSTALADCVAERDGDLMFLKDDEVTVLMQLPESGYYLGFCEGVVGRFAIADVQVHGKLKRAVMARRPASGVSSPTTSPITAPLAPSPSIPHTTYTTIRPHPIDQLIADSRVEDSLIGISTLRASPISESLLPNSETETESEHPNAISLSPPSSPLRINTTTATATPIPQRESLTSLASTEASPLSDTSTYSFRQPINDQEMNQRDTGGQLHEQIPEFGEVTGGQTEPKGDDGDDKRNSNLPSPRSLDTGNSRTSSPSIGDPFQHDTPARAVPAFLPFVPEADSFKPRTEEEGVLYVKQRESTCSGDTTFSNSDFRSPSTSTTTGQGNKERISVALSDGEVGIGLTLMGGLLGAGRDSMSEYEGEVRERGEGSESDYGREEGYGIGTKAKEAEPGEDDSSLYGDDSLGDSNNNEETSHRAGSVLVMEAEDRTPLATGAATPVANGGARTSQGSTDSRSSTPPFGFELEPTRNNRIENGKTNSIETPINEGVLVSSGTPSEDERTTSVDEARSTPVENNCSTPVDEFRSSPGAAITGDAISDVESDYGQEVPLNPTSPTFIPHPNSAPPDTEDFEATLPPFRPPYHRASGSMRSITSSDAGGYYDDGIYDHYRYSHISMAARSMRMSMMGGGSEMPPLPLENERGEGRRFAPLNIHPKPSSVASGSGSGSQASPKSQGPMSPTSQGSRSPFAQGEPASPRSMISGSSPLAGGPVLQAQIEKRHEERLPLEPGPAATTGLTPITTSGLNPISPGALTVPLSPTPSVGPPSPALSANLASSLRQAIEQQRADHIDPTVKLEPDSQGDTHSVDENNPVLGSPLTVQGISTVSPIASLQRRPSQFAPHPNAPKPAHLFAPSSASLSNPSGPSDPTLGHQSETPHLGLHDALQMVVQRLRTGGVRTPTIHGRTHSELGLSLGPVPISFVFDPDGRSALNTSVNTPSRVIGGAQRSASMSVASGPGGTPGTGDYVGSRLRPRSRSFSAASQEDINALKSAGEPRTPIAQSEVKSGSGVVPMMSSPLVQPPTPGFPHTPAGPTLTSLAANTSAPTFESPSQPPPSSSPTKRVASPPTNITSASSSKGPFRGLRSVASNTMMRVGFGSGSAPPSPVVKRRSSDNLQQSQRVDSPAPRQKEPDDIPHAADTLGAHTPSSASVSTSPMASSSMSLHSKISSTGPRVARTNAAATDTPTTPLSPVGSVQLPKETIHFHDMDFDMVKPSRGRTSVVRTSEDGTQSIPRSSHQSDRLPDPVEDDNQTSSPTSPITALPSLQTQTSVSTSIAPKSSGHNSLTTPSDIAAHISREQRWINMMQTIPSSSVRKNKKLKKLLLEGVPASVRGVVWLYLTDSKARRMTGLYAQLTKRAKVPAIPEILKDAELCFTTQPHLQATDGPVVSLLQAYLSMVPDITYNQGLCQLAGNLLMHSPEEDAFWTFVALMDNYLRGYCATNSVQMEVDSVFFAKTLESNDPQLAAKLFRELGLGPVDFCKPWILSGFTGVVPFEFACRIWDIFLFEGAPFLFRVALALLSCLRKQIMALTAKSSPGALSCLLSVSPQLLPEDPDQLIASAYSVKFKDDDMRKTRPKIEAQLRKESGLYRTAPIRDALRK